MTKDGYGFINHRDPQTLNLYTYVGNNPVNRVDPTGHWMEGDELLNFTNEETEQIEELGNAWWEAETQEERDAVHAQADAIRDTVKERMRDTLGSVVGYDTRSIEGKDVLEAYKHDLKIVSLTIKVLLESLQGVK